jgi:hypothetical protein
VATLEKTEVRDAGEDLSLTASATGLTSPTQQETVV